jgi:hypothetical protein
MVTNMVPAERTLDICPSLNFEHIQIYGKKEIQKQTPRLLVRKRIISTERLPLVGEF